MTPHTVENAFIQFKGNNGFSRHGDTVSLFADRIDNLNNSGVTSGSLALQLWACPEPYSGGNLTGWKLAELQLGILQAQHFIASIESEVPACFPEHGDYVMVLVIAEWDGEGFFLIHDFRNYPSGDVLPQPRLEGLVGYRCIDDGHLVVEVERIHNPRDSDNLSGTLSLELWALSEPYVVGDFTGHPLAGVTLGSLPGNESWQNCSYDFEISQPPSGIYTLVLMLREWTGNGYVTRDHSNFRNRVTFPLVKPPCSFPEAVITNNTGDEVLNPLQSPEAPSAVRVAGRTEQAANEAESPLTEADSQTETNQRKGDRFVSVLFASVRGFTRWALEKIKRQLLV